MPKKALILVDQDPEIKAKIEHIRTIHVQAQDQLAFLERRAEDIKIRATKAANKIWKDIGKVVVRRKLVPGGLTKNRFIAYDDEQGTLILCDSSDCDRMPPNIIPGHVRHDDQPERS